MKDFLCPRGGTFCFLCNLTICSIGIIHTSHWLSRTVSYFLIQNLLASHDIVAQRDYLPKLRDVPVEVDEDEETVKLVQLVKSQEPLVSKKCYLKTTVHQ